VFSALSGGEVFSSNEASCSGAAPVYGRTPIRSLLREPRAREHFCPRCQSITGRCGPDRRRVRQIPSCGNPNFTVEFGQNGARVILEQINAPSCDDFLLAMSAVRRLRGAASLRRWIEVPRQRREKAGWKWALCAEPSAVRARAWIEAPYVRLQEAQRRGLLRRHPSL